MRIENGQTGECERRSIKHVGKRVSSDQVKTYNNNRNHFQCNRLFKN